MNSPKSEAIRSAKVFVRGLPDRKREQLEHRFNEATKQAEQRVNYERPE